MADPAEKVHRPVHVKLPHQLLLAELAACLTAWPSLRTKETDLPTVAEIEASLDVLSVRTSAVTDVRARLRFAVKIGYPIPPLEAENRYMLHKTATFRCRMTIITLSIRKLERDVSLWVISQART